MTSTTPATLPYLVARRDQPLIAIPGEEDGEEVTYYFVDEEAADAFVEERRGGAEPDLSWIGAWAHLDWDEFVEEIDRIRHQSKPTPPIDDL
jgi:hypothetical protein